jgi:hypothetical protein
MKKEEKMTSCPFNKSHLVSQSKFLTHIHRCKEGKGKLDKLIKCQKDPNILFFEKEEHLYNCKKCHNFYNNRKSNYKENDSFNKSLFPDPKFIEQDSRSIITDDYAEDFDIATISNDFDSFFNLTLNEKCIDYKLHDNIPNTTKSISNKRKKEISDFDISCFSRKI